MIPRAVSIGAHRLWLATQYGGAREFDRALADPGAAQTKVLDRLIAANHDSAFGRAHGFARLRSIEDFRSAVPVRTYDEWLPWIDRAKRGEPNVLTSAPVVAFECSSGSTGAIKFVPYTRPLLREFQRALAAWLYDLYASDPALTYGPAFWVVTPLARTTRATDAGVRIGLDRDSEYLGFVSARLANRLLAAPPEIAAAADLESALYLTLRFLIQHRRLAFISVWNPSFLTVLCRALRTHGDRLIGDLESGGITGCDQLPPALARRLRQRARRDVRQARVLREMLGTPDGPVSRLWPGLRMISCWTSAEAAGVITDITRLLPGVPIQAKGLLATEGVTSIPLRRFGGAVPALTSHFLEFARADDGGIYLAHELDAGREYIPILTTGGGLWRYRTGDRVRVSHIHDGIPVLEFAGRDDGVCDLRGEKLHPAFVSDVFDTMRQRGALRSTFAMLTPAAARDGYVLFTDSELADAGLLDRLLRANPHYSYCRDVGQLRAPELFHIAGDAHAQYLRHCERLNRRAGTAKIVPLDRLSEWAEAFARREECRL